MKKLFKGCLVAIGLIAIVAVIIVTIPSKESPSVLRSPEPAKSATPTTPPEIMYFCGIDRCLNSGTYGEMLFRTGINVWNNPEPNRGGVHHQASHGDKVIVIEEKQVDPRLWYRLKDGGWTNDLWLTDEPCTFDNIDELSIPDC